MQGTDRSRSIVHSRRNVGSRTARREGKLAATLLIIKGNAFRLLIRSLTPNP